MIDDPDVFGGFGELWRQSLAAAEERGGWLVAEPGGGYRLVPFQDADYSACGIDVYESPPPGAVSLVHTHPWPLLEQTPCGYVNTGTPSEEDVRALSTLGFTWGYFLDAKGIGKFTANGNDQARRTPRCGY